MVEKRYSWKTGATLEEHSRRKHKIVREYFARYLAVRCQRPVQTKFRLAIVDGFAGGGRYKCGSPGSPIIFMEELRVATEELNIKRHSEGMAPLDIECFLILNDFESEAINILKEHMAPILADIAQNVPKLHLQVKYLSKPFEEAYPEIKEALERGEYKNVLFNLDQCGHSKVELETITDVIASFASAEIFYTFGITSLLTFLQKSDPNRLSKALDPLGVREADLEQLDAVMNEDAWLGAAERLVFESFKRCSKFHSPFSINNQQGWRYWLIHFASSYRARQEYNDILHQNKSAQAHFGRSGLNMLSYDTHDDSPMLYLFDEPGRIEAKKQLYDDIPRLISGYGDAINVSEFYESIYNATPAHTDDVHSAIIENPDLEVITADGGGERRKPNTIRASDTLRIRKQLTFPKFFGAPTKPTR
jgi:three-Cys-motif partner protein